jgi:hypothetical protein
MSLHYEWMLALRLRPDAPAAFLAELRFHLGLAGRPETDCELGYDWPCLVAQPDDALPGGGVRSLIEQRPGCLGLFVRTFVLDDAMYELMRVVPGWLARWSLTEGWIGHAREEFALEPWLTFYVQGGHAYAAEPGRAIEALDDAAPPFTARGSHPG